MGSKIKRVATAVSTGGLSELKSGGALSGIGGGLKDTLFGKQQTIGGETESQAALNRLALQQAKESGKIRTLGFKRLKEESEAGAKNLAVIQAGREARATRSGMADAQRKLQGLVARRGLSGSSIGLGQEVGIQRRGAERLAQIQASIPERAREMRQQQTDRLLSAAGGRQVFQQAAPKQTGRRGGLAPLLGAGIGAAFGGPAGAQLGLGIGQAAQGSFS
jgi:hypothetical protein